MNRGNGSDAVRQKVSPQMIQWKGVLLNHDALMGLRQDGAVVLPELVSNATKSIDAYDRQIEEINVKMLDFVSCANDFIRREGLPPIHAERRQNRYNGAMCFRLVWRLMILNGAPRKSFGDLAMQEQLSRLPPYQIEHFRQLSAQMLALNATAKYLRQARKHSRQLFDSLHVLRQGSPS